MEAELAFGKKFGHEEFFLDATRYFDESIENVNQKSMDSLWNMDAISRRLPVVSRKANKC